MKQEPVFEPVTTPEQIAATAQLADVVWHECYSDLLSLNQIKYMVGQFQSVPAIQNQINNGGYFYYIIKINDTNAGYLAVCPENGKLLLSKIYLLASYRGMGISPAIFAFCETLAPTLGCQTLWLTVNRGNNRAVAAYQKAGFKTVREQVVDIGGGYVMDDFVMEKSL